MDTPVLNKDCVFLILNELDDESVLNFSRINKHYHYICSKDEFWRNRYHAKLMKYFDKTENISWKYLYIDTVGYSKRYKPLEVLTYSITNDRRDIVSYTLHRAKNSEEFQEGVDHGYYIAVNIRRNELAKKFIDLGAEVDFYHAAKTYNRDIMIYLIKQGVEDWNSGLFGAIRGKHDKLITYFLRKGANDWVLASYHAAYVGDKKLFKTFLDKTDMLTFDQAVDKGLEGAVYGNHLELIEWLSSLANQDELDNALATASENGNLKVVKFLMEKGAKDIESGLERACDGGQAEMADFFIQQGARNFNLALEDAIMEGSLSCVKLLIEHDEAFCNIDLEGRVELAREWTHKELIGPDIVEYLEEIIKKYPLGFI